MLSLLLTLTMAGTPAAAPAASTDEKAVMAVHDAFVAAFNKKDFEGLTALYADDAVMMPPGGPAQWQKGKAAIRAGYTAMFQAPGTMTLTLHDSSQHVQGNLAYAVGLWTFTVTDPSGKKTVSEGRYSETLEKRGGKWLLVVDHASEPMAPPPPAATGAATGTGK